MHSSINRLSHPRTEVPSINLSFYPATPNRKRLAWCFWIAGMLLRA